MKGIIRGEWKMKKDRMLVIDDDNAVLISCQAIFRDSGFEVDTTTDPVKGLEMSTRGNYTVILCDWKMPGLNGMDVVSELEERSPEAAVVMFSGFPSPDRAAEAIKRGAMEFLTKPFTPEELTQVVRKAMDGKIRQEKKAISRAQQVLGKFPVPSLDDKGPSIIAETVAQNVGVAKANSPWISLFVLGVLAGAYIGFGGLFSTSVTFDFSPVLGLGLKKLVCGAAFSIGLMLVVIAGAELFTGNSLMVSSVMTGQITFKKMAAQWGIVYGANFLGSILLALLFYGSGLWKAGGGKLGQAAVGIALAKVHLSWSEAFIRAVGCNWMVCLAVWMALASRQTISKIFAVFFPIMGFVAIGFEHCVANMYFIPSGIFLSHWAGITGSPDLTWTAFIVDNLVPVTLGNIIGGALFVGVGYWGAYLRPRADAAR